MCVIIRYNNVVNTIHKKSIMKVLLYIPAKCNTHTPNYCLKLHNLTLYIPAKCNTHTPHVTYTTETQRVTLHFAIPKSLLAVA